MKLRQSPYKATTQDKVYGILALLVFILGIYIDGLF